MVFMANLLVITHLFSAFEPQYHYFEQNDAVFESKVLDYTIYDPPCVKGI